MNNIRFSQKMCTNVSTSDNYAGGLLKLKKHFSKYFILSGLFQQDRSVITDAGHNLAVNIREFVPLPK